MTTRHSRDDVVATALDLLDEHGLADLTMRRLAAALDVQASALYWHVPNKQSLLALVADRILERARPVEHDHDWPARLRAESGALRDALLAYRDGAEVVSSTIALGLGASAAWVRLLEATATSDATLDERELAASVLLEFIVGHVFREQQQSHADAVGAAAPERALDRDLDGGRVFGFGVDLIVDGFRARVGARA
jgi:AcrR family transcriptional regulator